jgi:hypothetical protein
LTGPDYTIAHNPSGIAKIDAAAGGAVRIDGIVSIDQRHVINDGLSVSNPTSAVAYRSRQSTSIGSARVRWISRTQTSAEIRVRGYTSPRSNGSQLPDGDLGPPAHNEELTGVYSVNVAGFASRDRRVVSIGGSATHYVDAFLRGSHELKVGIDYQHSRTHDVDGFPGGRNYYDEDGAPDIVELWNGSEVQASAIETALYAQDGWRIADRINVNVGVRVDVNRGSVPGSGTVFSTTPVSPRVGVAWDVFGDHRTVLKTHYGVYGDPLYTNLYRFKDQTRQSPDIFAKVLGPDQFVEVEREQGYQATIDRTIAQPRVTQTYVGVARELVANAVIEARYINRRFTNFIGNVDTGSVWVPTTARDPGPDNIAGTADDGAALTLYRLTNPGQRALLATNPDAAYRRYDAVQIIATKRYSDGWQVLAGYTLTRTAGTVASGGTFANAFLDRYDLAGYGPFADPNRLLNKDAAFTSTELKVEGTYSVAPLGGANLSVVFRRVSGAPVRRLAQFSDLIPSGPEPVIVEPKPSTFLDAQRTLDVRVEKTVPVGRSTLGVYLDVFNATNQGVATSVAAVSGRRFGTPLTWSDPRIARAGVRWAF